MKEFLSFSNPKENIEEKKEVNPYHEKRAYEKDPLSLPFFHSTHFSNFLKIMESGGICSGYNLIKQGLERDKDFIAKNHGIDVAVQKVESKGQGKEVFYNGVFFSVGGIPEEAKEVYYSKGCPITFLLDQKGLKNYAFGASLDRGDLIVANKDIESPTRIKLSDFSAVFIPEDVYFDNDGNMIDTPCERISKDYVAEEFSEEFGRFTNRLNKYEGVVKKIKEAGLVSEVNREIKNAYSEALNNLYIEMGKVKQYDCETYNYSKEYKEKIEILERYKEQIEWNGINGLLALGNMEFNLFRRYFNFGSLQEGNNVVKEFAFFLLDNFPYPGSGFSEYDKDAKRKYYEQEKESIDELVGYMNEKLELKGSETINSSDAETFKGRIFYDRYCLYRFVQMQREWKEYQEANENLGHQTFKELMLNFISKKGAIIEEEEENQWIIKNYKDKNFPQKIVFFNGELTDAVNEYTFKEYGLELPERELRYNPYGIEPIRTGAAKVLQAKLKHLQKKGLSRYVGKVPAAFTNAETYSFKRSRFGKARLRSRICKQKDERR